MHDGLLLDAELTPELQQTAAMALTKQRSNDAARTRDKQRIQDAADGRSYQTDELLRGRAVFVDSEVHDDGLDNAIARAGMKRASERARSSVYVVSNPATCHFSSARSRS